MTTIVPQPRRIGILGGTGLLGSAIALRLARAGHVVLLGSRDAGKAARKAEELNRMTGKDIIESGDNPSVAERAEVVFLTVPFASEQSTVEQVRSGLKGKILVDTTVPLEVGKAARVSLPAGGSAVAAIQDLLGPEVRVVSAFQNVSAAHLRHLDQTVDCDILVCGNDAEARALVIDLAGDMGLRAIHAGSIRNSAATEALTSALIAINIRYKVAGAGIRITGLDGSGHGDGRTA